MLINKLRLDKGMPPVQSARATQQLLGDDVWGLYGGTIESTPPTPSESRSFMPIHEHPSHNPNFHTPGVSSAAPIFTGTAEGQLPQYPIRLRAYNMKRELYTTYVKTEDPSKHKWDSPGKGDVTKIGDL